MKIKKMIVSDYETNCYILSDEKTKEAVIIDPGDDGVVLMEYITQENLQVKYILNTHGHNDHVGNNDYMKEKTKALVAIHADDVDILTNPKLYIADDLAPQQAPDIILHNGDEITFGEYTLSVLYTPGHTKGGVCFWEKEAKLCFCGDTLFRGTIGRADLYGGDIEILLKSVRERMSKIPDDTQIYPGHGPASTMGYERKLNRYLKK